MVAIQTIFERSEGGQACLPDKLRAEYDGDLKFPGPPDERPYLVANLVSTLDGVVSFNIPGKSGGGPISGGNAGDRFIMGLLRASADAVLVGSGTVQAVSPNHIWIAEYINPEAAALYDHYRRIVLGKPKHPITAVVSGTGSIDLTRALFHVEGIKVLVLTTEAGSCRLMDAGATALSSVIIRVLPAQDGKLAPAAILRLLNEDFGAGLVLHEGGPALLGQFLSDALVDELCLTLAPQIAGRQATNSRPALVMGTAFLPGAAPWFNLLSAKRGGDHLYLRYRLRTQDQSEAQRTDVAGRK
jgi:riboflavin biosynthesis pyrimidine reductase